MSFLTWLGFSPKMGASIKLKMDAYETRFDVYAQDTARSLGLKGWVHMTRLPQYKRAEIEIEGTKANIEKFLKQLNAAPADAKATAADVQWKIHKNLFQNFRIRQ